MINLSIPILFLFGAMPFASPVDFFIAGSVNGGVPEMRKNFSIKTGDELILYPVAVMDSQYFSPADSFRYTDGSIKKVEADPGKLAEIKRAKVRWFKISPVLKEYDNLNPPDERSPIFWLAPVEYNVEYSDQSRLRKPLSFFDLMPEETLGTFYLTFRFDPTGEALEVMDSLSFADIKPVHMRHPYKVVQITVRADDTYMGYLTELFNTPFILPPKRLNTGDHQTDIRVGSDCAEFAIYGKRRQGLEVKYLGPRGIYHYLDEISPGVMRPGFDGVYTDDDNNVLDVGEGGVQPGDIIHFGEQVSVFYRDVGFEGLLDKQDSLLQSYEPAPHYTTLEYSGFFHLPVRVFRWKEDIDPIWDNPWHP
ncbi:hypothetical protein GF359_07015 [candidate division WOR-3 bacterium]|uniref:Gingipain propeptide domain-containing protein n=1 Tax=candidate division WOR-3 bacterium TaxID=2052148 RepID=A0A9D5QCU9_UNCW3|nr:hypothetical protein [candidate division WOR-3 bacterium]MBD3364949.1 hypothetical protein [candidate division WOR-3 bacterium]